MLFIGYWPLVKIFFFLRNVYSDILAICKLGLLSFLLSYKLSLTNQDILKNTDIILPAKLCLVEAMVFPMVMYGCDSWTIKKAEH